MGFVFDPLIFSGFVPGPVASAGVPIYPTSSGFPATAARGSLAVAADTGILYEFNGTSWVEIAGAGVMTGIGTIDSQTPSADGAVDVNNSLILQSASATVPGLVNNAIQTFSGNKTIQGTLNMNSHNINSVSDPVSQQDAMTLHYATATYIPLAAEGVANGVATLDSSGKIPVTQLPSVVMEYQGSWNPNTNTPTLSDGTGTNGYVYYVTALRSAAVSGLTDPSMVNFQIGDLIIYSAAVGKWQLVTPAAGVQSVNGSQGAVTVNAINQLTGDVTAGPASGSASAAATIAAGAVTAAKLATITDGVTLDQAGSGATLEVKTGGIGTTQLAATSVTAAKLGTITDGITLDQSGAGATLEIKAAGVGSTQLASGAVTAVKLGTIVDGVTLDQAGAGSTLEIKTSGVTNAKLANMATNTVKANITGSSAAPTDVPLVSTATASAVMIRDANKNVQVNGIIENVATTATAAGTTTLTVSSSPIQQFTGTSTQIVILPAGNALTNGQHFYISNRSTASITVETNGGATLQVMSGNTQALFVLINSTTSVGVWDVGYTDSSVTGNIEQTSFVIANNQASAANVTGLVFPSSVRSAIIQYSIFINATTSLYEAGQIQVIQKNGSWDIAQNWNFDNSNVIFTVTSAGQVQYTSGTYTGFVSGKLQFLATVTSV